MEETSDPEEAEKALQEKALPVSMTRSTDDAISTIAHSPASRLARTFCSSSKSIPRLFQHNPLKFLSHK